MNNKSRSLEILYDQTQYTPLWMFGARGLQLNRDSYVLAKRISGYAPETWVTYTQNKPDSFFFGAYSQKTLGKEAQIGFSNFTNKKFSKKFELAVKKFQEQARELSIIYFKRFFRQEKRVLDTAPNSAVNFLKKVKKTLPLMMAHYVLTQPQRFYKFEKEIKKYLPNPDLDLISTVGSKPTYVSQVNNIITNLAREVAVANLNFSVYRKKNSRQYKKIEKNVTGLGFINWGMQGGELFDDKYIQKEVKRLLGNRNLLKEEVEKNNNLMARIDARDRLLQKHHEKEYLLADIVGNVSVWRYDLQAIMASLVKYADNLIKYAQKKYFLTNDEIASYCFDEIIDLINFGVKQPKNIINTRQKGFLVVWGKNKARSYEGSAAHGQIKELLARRVSGIIKTSEVRGVVASWPNRQHRIVLGRAFVLTSAFDYTAELKKFKVGDILVAPQTHPNIVPQMKRAMAIVTDEGGITCHAAIVSREIGKPCIIGTKLSTKIFRTGDRIRLDFKTGSVRAT